MCDFDWLCMEMEPQCTVYRSQRASVATCAGTLKLGTETPYRRHMRADVHNENTAAPGNSALWRELDDAFCGSGHQHLHACMRRMCLLQTRPFTMLCNSTHVRHTAACSGEEWYTQMYSQHLIQYCRVGNDEDINSLLLSK